MLNDILWTDKAYFSTGGCVNRHNTVIYGSELPTHTHLKGLQRPVSGWQYLRKID